LDDNIQKVEKPNKREIGLDYQAPERHPMFGELLVDLATT